MGALDTMADWQPDEGILNQIIQLCAMSAQAKDSATHKQVYAELEKFKQMQDYSLYQCWVFFMCENQNVGVRQMAGLQLKEFIKLHGVQAQQHLPQLVVVIRQCLGQALTKPHDAAVRRTLSTLVTQMVTSLGVWPELLQALVVGLQNQDLTVIDLSMSCLVKLSEDSPEKLDEGPAGQTPLDAIIPIMIQAMAHPTQANFRLHALNFTNQLLLMWPDSLEQNLMGYLQNLFRLDSDPSEEVRQKVYVAVASLTEDRVHVLQEHLSQVIGFVLKGTNDPCEDVKREATEFWSILADVAQAKELLKATLPQLLPVLLTNMQFAELICDCTGFDLQPIPRRDSAIHFAHHQTNVGKCELARARGWSVGNGCDSRGVQAWDERTLTRSDSHALQVHARHKTSCKIYLLLDCRPVFDLGSSGSES